MPLDLLAHRLKLNPGALAAPEDTQIPRAAVAAIFRPGFDLLFIRRSEREGDPWSGHMAFPGGRASPEDRDLRATAEREVREEVGLDLSGAELLGRLNELATPRRARTVPRLVVTPFVFRLERSPPLQANHEVAEYHWFSLDRLRSGEGRGTMDYLWQGDTITLPCVRLDGTCIWGLTLMLVDDLLERLAE